MVTESELKASFPLKRRSINMSTRWIPKGFHTITPNIIVDDAEQAVAFFEKAFGATETYRLEMQQRMKAQGY
jgi:hypothetical protein